MGHTRKLLALLAFVLGIAVVPHRVCEREADAWFDGDPAHVDALAAQVAAWTETDLAPRDFVTGSSRFDGEWQFGTYMMAAMGFGQVVLERPELREESLARMERCLDMMLSPAVRAFDTAAWNEDALASLASDHGHAAYLGYMGLALGLYRNLRTASRFSEAHDRIVAALLRRLEAATVPALLETYPGEVYPVDNASVLAAIALHARALGRPLPPAVARGLDAIREKGTDRATGLLFQAVNAEDGSPRDGARASGTALGAYFLGFVDAPMSAALHGALAKEQFRTVLGFGAMLEYAAGASSAHGDIDSGPIAFGFGVSATGFALGSCRMHDDRETFSALYATTHLFGAPFDEDGKRTHATGGPLGDAILFAMMTAPRKGRLG